MGSSTQYILINVLKPVVGVVVVGRRIVAFGCIMGFRNGLYIPPGIVALGLDAPVAAQSFRFCSYFPAQLIVPGFGSRLPGRHRLPVKPLGIVYIPMQGNIGIIPFRE